MSYNDALISNITLLRKAKNMPDTMVAQRLRIPVSEYRLYESGVKELPLRFFFKLAKLYRVTMEDFISEKLSNKLTNVVERMEKRLAKERLVIHNAKMKEILKQIRNSNKIEKFEREPNQNFY